MIHSVSYMDCDVPLLFEMSVEIVARLKDASISRYEVINSHYLDRKVEARPSPMTSKRRATSRI